jgi:hypothetical protein
VPLFGKDRLANRGLTVMIQGCIISRMIHELFLEKIRGAPLRRKREISVSISIDYIRVTLDDGWIRGLGIKQVL